MSEQSTPDFDARLATLAGTVADAAELRSATAIRDRGRQRTRRGRAVGAVLATAALAAVTVTALNMNDEHDEPHPVISPKITASPTWRTVDPKAWLPPDRYPLYGAFRWTEDGGVTKEPDERQSTHMCQERSMNSLGMQGYQLRSVKGTAGGWSRKSDTWQAHQQILFFKTPAKARAAYTAIAGGLARCQETENTEGAKRTPRVQVTVKKTASIVEGSAWSRRGTGTLHAADHKDDHTAIVRRGSMIAIIWIYWDAGPHPAYDTGADRPLLQQLATRLETYARP
ncbi:hypothetical protein ACGFNU_17075 [Spirillospora sp. NPDC048911]|uniref:hypothetical protein n=1 Tax=Spirillospora sp. NPDC048911 TaxID=3364527 RepID=UPI003715D774